MQQALMPHRRSRPSLCSSRSALPTKKNGGEGRRARRRVMPRRIAAHICVAPRRRWSTSLECRNIHQEPRNPDPVSPRSSGDATGRFSIMSPLDSRRRGLSGVIFKPGALRDRGRSPPESPVSSTAGSSLDFSLDEISARVGIRNAPEHRYRLVILSVTALNRRMPDGPAPPGSPSIS